jgi:hypothetical protein
MTWWITRKNVLSMLRDLRVLGYEGSTLAGIDPDMEGFYSFRDREVESTCIHEDGFERWSLRGKHLKEKSKLRDLDRELNAKCGNSGEVEGA